MSTETLLTIEPQELSFRFELNKQLSSSIILLNKTENPVAYKLLSTSPEKYGVRPRIGILMPGSACEVTVTMRAITAAPHSLRCKDKFMIKSAVASPGSTIEDARNMFNKDAEHVFQEYKLRVIYCKPMESSSGTENLNSNVSEVTELVTGSRDEVLQMSMRKRLDIQPPELQFPLKPNNKLSCSIQLANVTEDHVAFRVKTASPKYFVKPDKGIVLPNSTCEITVTMQAQTKDPTCMLSEDKLMIQSVVATDATTPEDIIPNMFDEAGLAIEECELQIVHISKEGETNNQVVEYILKGVISCLLCLVSWYLMRRTLSLIWSVTMVVMMLMIKMIKKLVSESVEDWIVKTLLYIFMHVIFGRKQNTPQS